MTAARRAITVWLLALAASLLVIARAEFTADMSAFLPKNPSPQQQLLVDQLKEGVLSRMLLIGIEGGDAPARAALSRVLAERMRAGGDFSAVRNGEAGAHDREILFEHRYLLSPAVTPERFSVAGLNQAIGDSIDLLASPAGLMLKNLLPRDPTGELMELLGALGSEGGPPNRHGAWASRDGQRAILMAQLRASGADLDAQEAVLARLRADFAELAVAAQVADARVLVSGSPVFAVHSRDTIRSEVSRLSLLGTAGIVCLLLVVYRSFTALLLGLLPVGCGVLAGIAAVSLGFGTVHGITIGFGTTLIGEAIDYSIYYFVQSQRAGDDGDRGGWMARFWPTIRLGVTTSTCGFAALLFSGFPGLAQLGLYSIAGLIAAAAFTRFVLPHLCPASFRIREIDGIGLRLAGIVRRLAALRWGVLALALAAAAVVASHRDTLWNPGLGGLSPIPPAAQQLDQSLRAELGAPDLRYLVVVSTPEREASLAAAERIGRQLQALVERGTIAGFETPTRFLPSAATQRARQQALPAADELAQRLPAALRELPLRAGKLQPFLDDVGRARTQPLLTPEALAGSTLALAVDSLLLKGSSGWSVILPLRAPQAGDGRLQAIDAAAIQRALAAAGEPDALFVDLLGETNRLYSTYLDEAILLSLAGFAAIVVLLAFALRSPARLARVLLPLVTAVLLVVAGLALGGEKLTLLHLVGLLLTVAVGSNYALFFDRSGNEATGEDDAGTPQTLASLALANCTTMIGFGILAFSQVPVLRAIGITVGPGAVLALLLAAILAGQRRPAP
ncbi:MAG: MMPL family transporter [Rhodocyclales bacterium]|nr:MMPL family transporter [Rhodocyclales bacterium]